MTKGSIGCIPKLDKDDLDAVTPPEEAYRGQRAINSFPALNASLTGGEMLPETQKKAYEAFFESTAENDILDEKITIMIQLAASFSIGCYP